MKAKTIRMSDEIYRKLKLLSVKEDKTIGDMIETLIEEYEKKTKKQ